MPSPSSFWWLQAALRVPSLVGASVQALALLSVFLLCLWLFSLTKAPVVLDLGPTLVPYGFLLTSSICQHRVSKQGHVPRFGTDMTSGVDGVGEASYLGKRACPYTGCSSCYGDSPCPVPLPAARHTGSLGELGY